MPYNPQDDAIVTSKPFGALGFNLDARSKYFDKVNIVRRPFISVAEVLTEFDTSFKREGNFTIFVNDTGVLQPDGTILGGTLKRYWWKDNTTDAGLVEDTSGGGGGSGTVTSVGVSVPTGLSVTNSPITTNGTIAIGLQSGYSIPTIVKQTSWDNGLVRRQIFVEDYRQSGEGDMSDTNAIKRAVDDASIMGGSVIFGDGIEYGLKEVITITADNVHLIGFASNVKLMDNTFNGFVLAGNNQSVIGFNRLEGSGTGSESFTGTAILLAAAKNAKVLYNNIINPSACGVYAVTQGTEAVENCEIAHNTIFNPMGIGGGNNSCILFGYNNETLHKYNDVHNNTVDGNNHSTFGIGLVGNGKALSFRNNKIKNCIHYGIVQYSAIFEIEEFIEDARIEGNNIENIGQQVGGNQYGSGIYINNHKNFIVKDNILDGTNIDSVTSPLALGAISMALCFGGVVSGNNITNVVNTLVPAIHLSVSDDVTINKNFVDNCESGVFTNGNTRTLITNNTFKTSGNCVFSSNANFNNSLTILGNKFKSENKTAVVLFNANSKNLIINDNQVDCKNNGIIAQGFDGYDVSHNNIGVKTAIRGIVMGYAENLNGGITNNIITSTDGSTFTAKIDAQPDCFVFGNLGVANTNLTASLALDSNNWSGIPLDGIKTAFTYMYGYNSSNNKAALIDWDVVKATILTSGTASIATDGATTIFTIAHGLGSVPSSIALTFGDRTNALANSTTTVNSTNIIITASTPPAISTQTVYWQAYK